MTEVVQTSFTDFEVLMLACIGVFSFFFVVGMLIYIVSTYMRFKSFKDFFDKIQPDAFIRLRHLSSFMREPDTTVVYTFKNASGNEIVLKKDCPDSHVLGAYVSLKDLANKILESEASE